MEGRDGGSLVSIASFCKFFESKYLIVFDVFFFSPGEIILEMLSEIVLPICKVSEVHELNRNKILY